MKEYEDIHIQTFSSASDEARYLIGCRGQYYEAGVVVANLITTLKEYGTEDEAIKAFLRNNNNRYTIEQIRDAIKKYIAPMQENKGGGKQFLYQKEIMSAQHVDRFSDALKLLFNKYIMVSVIFVALTLDAVFFLTTKDLLTFSNKVNAYTIIGLLLFMLASSFFHELGHASACKRFGIKHGGIGFGLYLNFPVLYTDVTEVWKLDRSRRCVVNIAGVYFQLMCIIPIIICFMLTDSDVLRYMIIIMNFGFVMTLNPFFKFDGYWMASDILGVPNLRQRSKEIIRYYINKLRRRSIGEMSYMLRMKKKAKWGFAVYAIVVNLFMAYYFLYVLPLFIYNFALSFPMEAKQLIMYLANNVTPPFALLRNIGAQMLFFALIAYMVYNVLYKGRKKKNGVKMQ
ncbi:MAG: hypothetical protein Q4D64_03790 [Prevotellaceae bacterium]|nr:hypothetical protein [Prevotellaceae bacterium]